MVVSSAGSVGGVAQYQNTPGWPRTPSTRGIMCQGLTTICVSCKNQPINRGQTYSAAWPLSSPEVLPSHFNNGVNLVYSHDK
ncbi:hypothetical protein C1H46_023261 [Malus baccata]|uniref:Uncharacterized protein n=1 Tax=Malus baccata TaxID=106549 RepID=A0A540LXZ8_MALBA|nr:hypothetical protein C1H46_023261 [Malus baccata]